MNITRCPKCGKNYDAALGKCPNCKDMNEITSDMLFQESAYGSAASDVKKTSTAKTSNEQSKSTSNDSKQTPTSEKNEQTSSEMVYEAVTSRTKKIIDTVVEKSADGSILSSRNKVAKILKYYALINGIFGLILSIKVGNYIFIDGIGILFFALVLVVNFIIFAFGEVVDLLNEIKNNTAKLSNVDNQYDDDLPEI